MREEERGREPDDDATGSNPAPRANTDDATSSDAGLAGGSGVLPEEAATPASQPSQSEGERSAERADD